MIFKKDIRPLSKLASGKEFTGDLEHRTGMYFSVHEDSSTESTPKLPAEVEFRKRSIKGIYLFVKAIPCASQNKIGKIMRSSDGAQLKIYVTTAPEDGKANTTIIALLAKELDLPKSKIIISKGHTKANKIIFLDIKDHKLTEKLKNLTKLAT